jgi:hypothetical protein
MLKINLLPIERRKPERTPLPRFMVVAATALVAAAMVSWVLWILLQIRGVTSDIEDKTAALKRLEERVAEHDKFMERINQLKAKIAEIDSVTKPESEWWRAINALWDVIHGNKRVWVDEIKVLNETGVQAEVKKGDPDSKLTPPFGVTMRCHVAGHDVAGMTKFRSDLKDHVVLQELLPLVNFNPDWKVDEEKDYAEKTSIQFYVVLAGTDTPPKFAQQPKEAPPAAPGGAR